MQGSKGVIAAVELTVGAVAKLCQKLSDVFSASVPECSGFANPPERIAGKRRPEINPGNSASRQLDG